MALLHLLHVFFAAATLSSISAVNSTYKGCFNPGSQVQLSFDYYIPNVNSVSVCSDTCAFHNYTVAGLSGRDCYCGNTYSNYTATGEATCNVTCPGNSQEKCGGVATKSIYELHRTDNDTAHLAAVYYNYRGCYVRHNSTTGHDLPFYATYIATISISFCTWICARLNYTFAGLNKPNCYCGNSFGQLGRAPSDGVCNLTCSGGTETCGGDNAGIQYNSVYEVSLSVQPKAPLSASWTGHPFRLLNHTIETGSASNRLACAYVCLSKAGCLSFNFIDASLRGDNCELNNQSLNASNPSPADAGWHYYVPHQ